MQIKKKEEEKKKNKVDETIQDGKKRRSNIFKSIIAKPAFLNTFLIVLQFFILATLLLNFAEYAQIFLIISNILSFIFIVGLLNNDDNSAYKLPWIMLIALVPVVGVGMYIVLTIIPYSKKISNKLKEEEEESRKYLQEDILKSRQLLETAGLRSGSKGLAKYLQEVSGFPSYFNNTDIRYFPEGRLTFEEMLDDIESAKEHVFIEFFIVSEGLVLDTFLELLEKKVKEGVKVKFMFDGTNEFKLLKNFEDKVTDLGIECRIFAKVAPVLSTYQNSRDHRKLVIIDGKIAYTGGINLADEYADLKERFGYWKDCGIRLKGPVAKTMSAQFLTMWNLAAKISSDYKNVQNSEYEKYLDRKVEASPSEGVVMPFGDMPGDKEQIGENIILHLLYTAKDYIYIVSPYFIVDNEILTAMKYAAGRGISVNLIMPSIPDKKIPYYVGQSYYPTLIENNVKVYQYQPGFLHSKLYLSDDEIAAVGTINMDYRSLHLHFENGIVFEGNDAIFDIKSDICSIIENSKEITLDEYKKIPRIKRLIGRAMRIFGPLM